MSCGRLERVLIISATVTRSLLSLHEILCGRGFEPRIRPFGYGIPLELLFYFVPLRSAPDCECLVAIMLALPEWVANPVCLPPPHKLNSRRVRILTVARVAIPPFSSLNYAPSLPLQNWARLQNIAAVFFPIFDRSL